MMPKAEKEKISYFQTHILQWFKKNGRIYPWRTERNAYRKLVAEMMLQRTRVEQVLPVYKNFIKNFPEITALANAKINEISKYVAKLGLFWRSKLIKEMAEYLIKKENGTIPETRTELLKVPGVGDYIADAMTVFVFGGRRTVIDGNVVRLTGRFFNIEKKGEIRRNRDFVEFCQTLSSDLILPDVKKFNYGLIDFSAAVCRREPLCTICPLSTKCSYFLERK